VGGVRNVFLRLLVMLVCMCDVHACMLLAVMPGVLLSALRRMFYSPLQPMPALGGSLCATGFVNPSRSTLDPVQHEQGPELRSYVHGCVARTVGSKGRGGQCHAPGMVLPMLSCHEDRWCEQALLPTPSRSAPCNRGTRTDSSSSSSSSSSSRRIMAPPRCQSGNRIGDLAHAGMGSARIAWGKGGEGQLVMHPV